MLRGKWESIGKEVGEGKEWQMNANERESEGEGGMSVTTCDCKFHYSLLSLVPLPPSQEGELYEILLLTPLSCSPPTISRQYGFQQSGQNEEEYIQ